MGFLRAFLCTIVFSLIIVKSLQLRGHRQIAEPRKYCLVRVIVFFDVCFLYFFYFSQVGILVKIPYMVLRQQGCYLRILAMLIASRQIPLFMWRQRTSWRIGFKGCHWDLVLVVKVTSSFKLWNRKVLYRFTQKIYIHTLFLCFFNTFIFFILFLGPDVP